MNGRKNGETPALIKIMAVAVVLIIAVTLAGDYIFRGIFEGGIELVREIEYEPAGIEEVYVDTASAEVEIKKSDTNDIVFMEYADKSVWNSDSTEVFSDDGRLVIRENEDAYGFNILFDRGKKIVLMLPEKVYDRVDISIGSGEADVSGIMARTGSVHIRSGKARVESVDFEDALLNVDSGKMEANGSFDAIDSVVASGRLEVSSTVVPDIMRLQAVSGSMDVEIPDNTGFMLSYEKASGSIKSEFLDERPDGTSGTAVYGSGERTYEASVASGRIEISRRDGR